MTVMDAFFPHVAETDGVTVRVAVSFLSEQSEPERGRWFWAYHIRIENSGHQAVQLLTRHWIITDAEGVVQEVQGAGVVGEQPVLEPGETFDYTSGTPLPTPSGFMRGTYHMIIPGTGEAFDAEVPAFSLDSPHQAGGVH